MVFDNHNFTRLYEVEERIAADGTYTIKKNRLVRRLSVAEAGISFVE